MFNFKNFNKFEQTIKQNNNFYENVDQKKIQILGGFF